MLSWFLKISRPRFWLYLLGPYLIGLIAANQLPKPGLALLLGLYFLLPANLLIYGVNDLFDYETDKHNPKKLRYEALVTPDRRKGLLLAIAALNLPILGLLFWLPEKTIIGLLGFWILGVFYSAPPIRAKIHPFIDTVFNALYIFPGIVGYTLLSGHWPPVALVIASTLWCMAMHAYSAVPDIAADKQAAIRTVATALGARGTLLFCLACYSLAAVLSFRLIGLFAVFAGAVYVAMMLLTLQQPGRDRVFQLYKYFPYINMTIGGLLFFWVHYLATR